MLSGIPLFPEQASTLSPQVDALYFLVLAVTAFFAILVVVCVVVFAVKYRDRTGERLGAPTHGSILLELGWSVIPFLIAIVIFVWATVMFFQIVRPAAETQEIYSTGKRWMWRFQHIDGQSEINELHVPRGRPIRVTFTSNDVLHSLYVPSFSDKADAISWEGEKTSTSRYLTLGSLAASDIYGPTSKRNRAGRAEDVRARRTARGVGRLCASARQPVHDLVDAGARERSPLV